MNHLFQKIIACIWTGVKSSADFTWFTLKRYGQDDCLESASSLAFTTILSIIPVAIVMVSVVSNFHDLSDISQRGQNFLLDNLIPDAASHVREYVINIGSTTGKITSISLLFLLFTAILLVRSIDETINKIWKIEWEKRKAIRFLYYLLVVILSPILLGLSLTITSLIVSLPYIKEGVTFFNAKIFILGLLPVLLTAVVFTIIYKFSPRTYVSIKHARIGGFVAALLFELAKYIFSWYVIYFPSYQIIYGAVSFIPIFLMWIYISWAIILFGAEITYVLGVDRKTLKN